MKNVNSRKWSTPVVIGAGLFVAVSGVLMFFGVHDPVQLAHEWIGMLFAGAILLHILNHWSAFKKYFSQRMALSLVGIVLLATSTFIGVSAMQVGGNPMMKIVRSIEASTVAEVAPLLDESAQSVASRIQAAGFRVEASESSIKDIAVANGSEPRVLVKLLFSQDRS
jgi:hypothetical protein